MTSPIWGGLSGAFGGLSQGLQLLMQLRQAEEERKRQARQDERQGRMDEFAMDAPERALEAKAYDALLDAGVQLSPQDFRSAGAKRTPAMPAMPATSALAQAADVRGASATPEISLPGAVAGAKSRQLQQAMSGQAPESVALDRFGATVSPSESVQVAAINAANRPQPRQPAPSVITDDQGRVFRVPPTSGAPAELVSGATGKTQAIERGNISRMEERERATGATLALEANETIDRIESQERDIGARVMQKVTQQKTIAEGLIRKLSLSGVDIDQAKLQAEALVEASLMPTERAYYVGAKQVLGTMLPALSGKQVTASEFVMHAPVYFSVGGSDQLTQPMRARARVLRLGGLARESGAVFSERVKQGYLKNVDLTKYGFSPEELRAWAPPSSDVNVPKPKRSVQDVLSDPRYQ